MPRGRAPVAARLALVLLGALAACSHADPPAPGNTGTASAQRGSAPRYGAVMAEVGRRFETAGRASVAGRFELAEFEVGELEELFEDDLPRAEPPKEGAADKLPAMAEAFLKTYPPALKKAAAAKDRAAFAEAFKSASEMCNACHKASEHGFIEVPPLPGKPVPDVDPPAASGAPR